MAATLQDWTPETERSFKETLFRFLEEVNSTKAALYLLVSDGSYVLATQYGFGKRDVVAARHAARSPIVLKVREVRDKPFVVNHRDECPKLHDLLQTAGSERMLLAPVYGDSRLVGFVDARDKGRRRPFVAEDEQTAQVIAADLFKLAQMTGVIESLSPEPADEGVHEEIESSSQPPIMEEPVGAILDRAGLEHLYRCFVSDVVRESEISIAALTIADSSGVGSKVIAISGMESDEIEPLLRHQADVLREKGMDPPAPNTWSVQIVPREDLRRESGPPVAGAIAVVLGEEWAVVVGAVGGAESGAVPRVMHRISRRAREISKQANIRFSRNRLARGLLRPPGRDVAHLERHGLLVSRLSWLAAQELGLPRVQCETAALAGLLHDVGMLDMDYERLYRMKKPGPEDRKNYRNHVIEGERIVHEAGLGEIKDAIRHHHERWDGGGYPDGLVGEAIPVLARVVHAAEVWAVLTSMDSYRHPVTPERATETLQAEAARQFDPRVVEALLKVV